LTNEDLNNRNSDRAVQLLVSNLTCMAAAWGCSPEAPNNMEQFWLSQRLGLGELQPPAW